MSDLPQEPAEPRVVPLEYPTLYRALISATMDDPPPCQADPQLWNSRDVIDLAYAARVCRRCPHLALCADHAIANGEPSGVWGATTARERRDLRQAREGKEHTG